MIDHRPDFPIGDPSRWPVVMLPCEVGYVLRLDQDHAHADDMKNAVQHLKRQHGLRELPGFKATRFSRKAVLEFIERGGAGEGVE